MIIFRRKSGDDNEGGCWRMLRIHLHRSQQQRDDSNSNKTLRRSYPLLAHISGLRAGYVYVVEGLLRFPTKCRSVAASVSTQLLATIDMHMVGKHCADGTLEGLENYVHGILDKCNGKGCPETTTSDRHDEITIVVEYNDPTSQCLSFRGPVQLLASNPDSCEVDTQRRSAMLPVNFPDVLIPIWRFMPTVVTRLREGNTSLDHPRCDAPGSSVPPVTIPFAHIIVLVLFWTVHGAQHARPSRAPACTFSGGHGRRRELTCVVESKELKASDFREGYSGGVALHMQHVDSGARTPTFHSVTWCLKCRHFDTSHGVLVYWKVKLPLSSRDNSSCGSSKSAPTSTGGYREPLYYNGWMPGIVPGALISFHNLDMKRSKKQRVYFVVSDRTSVRVIEHMPRWNVGQGAVARPQPYFPTQAHDSRSADMASIFDVSILRGLGLCEDFLSFARIQSARRRDSFMRLPWIFIADVDKRSVGSHDGGDVCYRLGVSIVRVKFVRLGTVCSTCGGKLEVKQPRLLPGRCKFDGREEIKCEHGCSGRKQHHQGVSSPLVRNQLQARCEAQLSVVIEDGTSQAVTYMDGSLVWKFLRPAVEVLQKMEQWSVQCQGLQYWHDDLKAEPSIQLQPNVTSAAKQTVTLFEKKAMFEAWVHEMARLVIQRKFVFICEPLNTSSMESAKMRPMSIKMHEMEVTSHTLDQQKMKVLDFFEQDSVSAATHCIQVLRTIG